MGGYAFATSAPIQDSSTDFDNIKPISVLTNSQIQTTGTKSTTTAKPIKNAVQSTNVKSANNINTKNTITTSSSIQSQSVEFKNCNKYFKLDSQKLFYLTLAGVNANRFTINEIQSKSGYVLFTAGQKQFLASIYNIDNKNSMLKITPCSNIYFFQIGIIQNMFKYIELNINTPIENLKIL